MAKVEFKHPHVPFETNIAGGLAVGREVNVKGKAVFHQLRRFCINLGVDPQFRENIALHIGPSIDEQAIVLTTLKMGIWATGQRVHMPHMDHFEFHIKLENEHFHVSLNDRHIGNVPYQFPPHMVNHIEVEGACELKHIHIEGHPRMQTGMVYGAPAPMYAQPAPMYGQPAPVYMQQPYVQPMVVAPQPTVIVEEHNRGHPAGAMVAGAVMGAAIADIGRPHHGPVIVEPRRHGPVIVEQGRHHGPVIVERGHRRF